MSGSTGHPHRPRLVLASGSPRRRELLDIFGVGYLCRPVDIDETPLDNEEPETYVRRLAREKATAIAHPGEVVLAADTIVVSDKVLLGKPADAHEARAMLQRLSGRQHHVYTGVAVHRPSDLTLDEVVRTAVWIGDLTPKTIDWYVSTGEPDDKAGAYAIQGLGALLVERINGNYTNVVGLPLPTTNRLLLAAGCDLGAPGLGTSDRRRS